MCGGREEREGKSGERMTTGRDHDAFFQSFSLLASPIGTLGASRRLWQPGASSSLVPPLTSKNRGTLLPIVSGGASQ
jgi:hypothetical protein